jgi:hypothetical protein
MSEKPKDRAGKRVLTDRSAASASPDLPAFIARPEGTPVYHGFPLIEETLTDGWCFGAISAFEDDPEGCEWGDGFVVAPDGSRAGIVWGVGSFATYEICAPTPDRWGVYGVAFARPVRSIDDLVECFRAVLPDLKRIRKRIQ